MNRIYLLGGEGERTMRAKVVLLSFLILCCVPRYSAAQTSREVEAEKDIQAGKQAQLQGDYAQAAASYQAAVKLMPEVAELYGNLGIAYYLQKDYDKAIAAFQQALKRKPALEAPNLYLGMAYVRTARFADSIKPLQKALSINPKIREAYINLGASYNEIGKSEEGLQVLPGGRRFFPMTRRSSTIWAVFTTT